MNRRKEPGGTLSIYPSLPSRIALGVVLASAAALISVVGFPAPGEPASDFRQIRLGAHLILAGQNPYTLIGPGRVFDSEFPFIWPITASIIAFPATFLSQLGATAAFVGISAGLLGFAITRDGWYRLPMFLSSAFIVAARRGQWSPIFTAAACLPALSWVYCAKPTIGLAFVAATGSKRTLIVAVVGGIGLSLIGLILVPTWPLDWARAVRHTEHMVIPVTRPSGTIALLALLRWRRPEARLILALACVPQTISWYEVLPLMMVASNFTESLFLSLFSSSAAAMEVIRGWSTGAMVLYPTSTAMIIAFAYLPALVIVLRRPNEGPLPIWLEFALRRLGKPINSPLRDTRN